MAVRKHATLVAATKATATVTAVADTVAPLRPHDMKIRQVAVRNLGPTGIIFYSFDGTDPTTNGDDFFALAPGNDRLHDVPAVESQAVELISAGTPSFEVEAFSS